MHIVRPTNERESHMDTQQQHIAMTPTTHPTHGLSPAKKDYFTSKDFPANKDDQIAPIIPFGVSTFRQIHKLYTYH